jgi:hypothetical protein
MPSRQEEEHLNLLGILFYLYAGFVGLMGILFAAMAILPALLIGSGVGLVPTRPGEPSPWILGGTLLAIFGGVAMLFLTKAVVMIFAGRAMGRRTNYTLCMVGACLAIMNMPLGTALGIFTIILLQKPAVKARFGYP